MEMRKMKLALSAGALALSLALAGCGGGGSPQAAGPTPAETQHMDVSSIITAAETAVGALDAMSTDDDVAAAQAAIDAARDALNEADLLRANQFGALDDRLSDIEMTLASTESDIDDHRQMVASDQQHMDVSGTITAAETAVDGLTDMSTDAEVMAAQAAIDAARDALNEADLLSGNQVFALDDRLSDIEDDLEMAQAGIDDHRKMVADNQQSMDAQRMAANTAISDAMKLVDGLTDMSTDVEVMAAEEAIQDAKDAVAAATALSMADLDELNNRISDIEGDLVTANSGIADHRQVVAVGDAVDMAMNAVGDLDAMSTDEQVNAAQALITAAKTALDEATSLLTAARALELQASISTIEETLVTAQATIRDHRKMVADNEAEQRAKDVSAALMVASQSYMKAEADAKKAEAAAMKAAEGIADSQYATDADTAAKAARKAANDAKAAHDAIMDGMATLTKTEADNLADEAKRQAGLAKAAFDVAKAANDAVQAIVLANNERDRKNAVMAARTAANTAVEAAKTAKDNAADAAMDAEDARDAAYADFMKAKRARTDAAAAEDEYDKAKTAAMDAREAANTANTAYTMAMMAAKGIMDDDTADAAKSAQMMAEDEQGKAEDAADDANAEYMTAMTAMGAAQKAAGTHVIGLLKHANGSDLNTVGDPADVDVAKALADARKAQRDAVIEVINEAAAGANNINGEVEADNPSTAMATWAHDTPADAEAETPAAPGAFMITLRPNGSEALTFNSMAGTDAAPKTADSITGLVGFMHGYSISDDGTHAIVFTDIEQTVATVPAVTLGDAVNIVTKPVTASQIVLPDGVTDITTEPVEYDHDGDPDTKPLSGATLACGSAQTTDCSHEIVAGKLTSLVGYVVSVEAAADFTLKDAVPEMEDSDYLVFGVWLQEDGDGDDANGNQPAFAAFADGGTDFAVSNDLTGTATYKGSATGVYTAGSSVDYFQGAATLTAKFTTDAADTISGEVNGIMAGGISMDDDVITFNSSPIDSDGSFSGAARMGPPTVMDNEATYPYNGMWGGQLYGPAGDTDADTDAAATTMPTGAAGTFGVTGPVGEGDDAMTRSYVGAFGAHKTE